MAPELMPLDGMPRPYGVGVDIFSFGMVLYFMLVGDAPWGRFCNML